MVEFQHKDDESVLKHRTQKVKKQKEEFPNTCEVCGQEMERDPESGEYYCPDCYDSEYQE
jgi:protein-arginine kinase activator protein McsA